MCRHLTPLAVLERLIGPLDAIAKVAGLHEKSPFVWRRSSKEREAGDIPSTKLMRLFLAHAAARGIPLTADHLIWGADAAEIDALLAPSQVAAE